MKKITIKDIAKLSGYSVKTVSRVINNESSVKEYTRDKINKIIRENNYHTNFLAKGLKGDKINLVVVFIDRHEGEFLNIWHNMMLRHLFNYAKNIGIKIVVSPSNSDEYTSDETDGFNLISSGLANGAILLEVVNDDPRIKYLKEQNIPFVVFGEPREVNISSASINNYMVGLKGAEYLVGKGYRNIRFLVGDTEFISNQKRVEGFISFIKDSGSIHYEIVSHVVSMETAYEEARKILLSDDSPVDAFFVSGDERAIGVFKAIYEQNLNIPEDVAVLGIDNINIGNYLHPALSTIEQDFKTLAMKCLDLVSEEIKNDTNFFKHQIIRTEPVILERSST